jgi:glucose/mannose transport system substrate-binding protein
MLRKILMAGALATTALPTHYSLAADNTVEVLHWWTSGGEAAAVGEVKKALEAKGITWQDMPISGGSGGAVMAVLRARVVGGNPPTAAQLIGHDIQDWAKEGMLGNLDEVATRDGWDKVVPPDLQKWAKYDEHWIAAPININVSNWVWASKAVFDKAGITQVPTNWDEFIAALDKIKAAGFVPLALGGAPNLLTETFEDVLVSTGGIDFYKKALVDNDPEALASPTMLKVFERLQQLKGYVDPDFHGRDWNIATAMVITDKAGMQATGDWGRGEFVQAKKEPNKDFLCFKFPGTQDSVLFVSDMFAFFKVSADRRDAQLTMAATAMSPDVQTAFNLKKGSVPARTDISGDAFDPCSKQSMADIKSAAESGKFVGSYTFGMAGPGAIQQAGYDVLASFFADKYDPAGAQKALIEAFAAAKE